MYYEFGRSVHATIMLHALYNVFLGVARIAK